jgi:hypothetical protein
MLRLLLDLLVALRGLLGLIHDEGIKASVQQQDQKVLDDNVSKAEAVLVSPDPTRDKRLRSRFDAAEKPD